MLLNELKECKIVQEVIIMNNKNRIKKLRQLKKVSQSDLAKATGLTRQAISNYERGDREPKMETWQKFADFFNVSVLYVQGVKEKFFSIDEIVKIIHDFYFEALKTGNDQLGGAYSKSFVDSVNTYIKLTSKDKLPLDMYQSNDSNFELTDKIKSYWLKHFGEIINEPIFQSIPIGTNDYSKRNMKALVVSSFLIELNKKMEKKRKNLTSLGAYFKLNYGFEKELHDTTIDKIKYLDLRDAKNAFDKYCDRLNEIRTKIDNFKENDKYFDQYFSAFIKQARYADKDNISRNNIINEIVARVNNGDIKLRDYMINHGDVNIIETCYRDFKKQNNEDVSKLNSYLHGHPYD